MPNKTETVETVESRYKKYSQIEHVLSRMGLILCGYYMAKKINKI